MQEVPLWDYPVLYWLQRLAPEIGCVTTPAATSA